MMEFKKCGSFGLVIFLNFYSAVCLICPNGTSETMLSISADSFQFAAESFYSDYSVTFSTATPNITICMWIQPTRFSYVQAIMNFDDLHITLNDGFIGADIFSQNDDTFNLNVSLWQWTQFCILVSPKVSLYSNGESYTSDISYQIPSKTPATYTVRFGEDPKYSQPFSGAVAALYIYNCSLPENQLDLVADGNISTYCASYPIPSYFNATDTGIEKSEICSTQLTKPEITATPLLFNGWQNYTNAVAICKKFGGTIPLSNDPDLLTSILDYTVNAQSKLKSFWLQSSGANDLCLKGVIKTGQLVTQNVSCNSTQLPVFCLQNTAFRLLGFPLADNIFWPVPFKPFVYESRESKYRLSYDSQTSKLLLKAIESGEEFGKVTNTYEADVVGRHWWQMSQENTKLRMAFTACLSNQFTCDNGECIDIKKACDFQVDCPRVGFDEAVCSSAMAIDNSYQPLLAPMVNDQQLAQIGINITLQNMVELELSKGILTLTITIMSKWRDYRLRFKFLRETEKPIDKNTTKLYWHPNIKIEQALSADKDKFNLLENPGDVTTITTQNGSYQFVDSYEALVFGGKDVDMIHQKTEDFSIHCPIKMFLYPFDSQECKFSMELQSSLRTDAEINRNISKTIISGTLSLTIYKNIKFDMTFDDNNKQKAIVTFSVQREYGAFIFNIFMPCILLEIIGLMTHFLPIEDYPDRVAIAMSVLFVMAALFTMVSTSLPPSAQPKLVDIWMFGHTAILILIFAFQVIIIYLHYKKTLVRKEEEEDKTKMEKLFMKSVLKLKTPVVEPETGTSARLAWMDYLTDGSLLESNADEIANIIGLVVCTVVYIIFLVSFILITFYVK